MTVFIAHKTSDSAEARAAYNFLDRRGVEAYLAELDPDLEQGEGLTDYLREQINKRTDLLVLITPNSIASWWIPFETGIATQGDKRIATAVYSKVVNLPDFLARWPVITSEGQFAEYAELVKTPPSRVLNEGKRLLKSDNNFIKAAARGRQSDIFHEVLKRRLGQ